MGLATKPLELTQGLIPTASQWNSLFDTLYTTVNGNIDEANADTTKVAVLATAQTFTGIKTFTGGIVLNDDIKQVFGTGSDYWFQYDGSNTQFEFMGTNVDGGGTDGIIFKIDDGTDDVDFTGGMTVGSTVLVVDQANARVGIGGSPHASGPELQVLSTIPRWGLTESDASTNNQHWQWIANGGELFLQSLGDAWSGSGTFLGFTRSGASIGEIQFRNGTSVWDATGLGIGTTSPGNTLHVAGASGSAIIEIESTDASATELQMNALRGAVAAQSIGNLTGYWDGNSVAQIRFITGDDTSNKDNGELAFYTSPSGSSAVERVRIDDSGNVGIGTNSPDITTHILSGATQRSLLLETTDATGKQLVFQASGTTGNTNVMIGSVGDELAIYTGVSGNEMVRVDDAGNVGIGTTSPAVELDVAGRGQFSSGTSRTLTIDSTVTGGFVFQSFEVGGSEKFQLTSNSTTNFLTLQDNAGTKAYWSARPGGDISLGGGQLANAATDGFALLPTTTDNVPSGTPTGLAGYAPIVIDDTNHRLYIYTGSAWRYAALTT